MTEHNRLEIIRNFNAPPERLYDAWTVPEQVAQWFGPESVSIGEHNFETKENGAWRTEFLGEAGSRHIATGIYKVLDRPNKLVTSWRWETDGVLGEETELTLTFESIPSGTRMTLVHTRFTEADTRDHHHSGWTSTITCLENYIAT